MTTDTDTDTSQRISAEQLHAQRITALESCTRDHAEAVNILVRRVDMASWGAPYVAATLSLSTTALRVGVGLDPATLTTSVTTNVDTTRWSHLVATWNGTVLSGYINGALATAVAAVGTIIANASGRWGVGQIPQGAGASSEPFTGQIQLPRTYSTCLTADEVLRRYSRGVGMWRGTL